MLGEVYATTDARQSERSRKAILSALRVTLSLQQRPKTRAEDRGGWRYIDRYSPDTDLSIIGWQLMFLRSAKNAGFEVPQESIDDAVACVRHHFIEQHGTFAYTFGGRNPTPTRAMAGAGVLALAHAGLHHTPEAYRAGDSILQRPFDQYNTTLYGLERYHYSVFQCAQASYQLGGRYWEEFYPRTSNTLLANQNRDGSWAPENSAHGDGIFGNSYTTALVVLSLAAPNQLLPIFQR